MLKLLEIFIADNERIDQRVKSQIANFSLTLFKTYIPGSILNLVLLCFGYSIHLSLHPFFCPSLTNRYFHFLSKRNHQFAMEFPKNIFYDREHRTEQDCA